MRNRVFHKGLYCVGLVSDSNLLRMMYDLYLCGEKGPGCGCRAAIHRCFDHRRGVGREMEMHVRLIETAIELRVRNGSDLYLCLSWKETCFECSFIK
jgi:hypothetical protein